MKEPVISVNQRRGFIAVQTDGGITVIELLGGYEVDVGDIISGNLESRGSETLQNETNSERLDAFIQDIHCSIASARTLMQ